MLAKTDIFCLFETVIAKFCVLDDREQAPDQVKGTFILYLETVRQAQHHPSQKEINQNAER